MTNKKEWIFLLFIYFELSVAYFDSNEKVFVRKNAKDMTFDEWKFIKNGIREMKLRSEKNESDPTGYTYQANIHGWVGHTKYPEIAKRNNWHQCQHGQYFFLPWHRMYLYYFEKILRSAANNQSLTIPYWDYFDPEQRVNPDPFRIPSDSVSNPLFVEERCKEMNHGKPLTMEIANHDPALSSTFFTANKHASAQHVCSSFGSAETDEPMFDSDGHGVLEQMPHNQIHLFVGGPNGFLSDNCQAARDPIFWLHHAQIDRIWETWLKKGGMNPKKIEWLNESFVFYDEKGHIKNHKVEEILNTVKQLNYRYDKLIDTDGQKIPEQVRLPEINTIVEENTSEKLIISETSQSLVLSLDEEDKELFKELSKGLNNGKISIELDINYIKRGLVFDMYLNLPKGTYPNESPPYFIRPIVVLQPDCGGASQLEMNLKIKNCFDVTSNMKLILKHEENFGVDTIKSGILNVTFVPRKCGIKNDSVTGDWIKFNRIQMVYLKSISESSSLYLKTSFWIFAFLLSVSIIF